MCSSKLALSIIKVFEEEVNVRSLNGKSIENLIFFIDRVPITKMQIYNQKFQNLILQIFGQIKEQNLIQSGQLRDHLLILSLIREFNLQSTASFDEKYGQIMTDIEN